MVTCCICPNKVEFALPCRKFNPNTGKYEDRYVCLTCLARKMGLIN